MKALAASSYPTRVEALQALRAEVDRVKNPTNFWIVTAAIEADFMDASRFIEQSLSYAFDDPWPWKTADVDLALALAALDAEAPP